MTNPLLDLSKLRAPSVIPQRDAGVTGLRHGEGSTEIYEEFLPNMRSLRQRTDLFQQISSNSPIVGASLHLIRSFLARAPLVIEAAGDKPRHKAAADFVRKAFPAPMSRAMLDDAATMLIYGFSLVEISMKRDLASGRWVFKKLAPRSPRSVTDWVWDMVEDEPIAFTQQSWATGREIVVPLNRCLHFRVGRGDADNPEGVSLLRHAYTPDYYARRLTELEGIGIERDLAGLPVIRVPGELLDPDATAEQRAALASFEGLLSDIRRDKAEGIIIPSDRDESGNPYFDVTLLSVNGNRQVQVSQSIERHEKRVAQAFLTGFLFLGLGSGGTGSYALSDNTTGMFKASLTTLLDSIADQVNERAIAALWRQNGLPEDTKPTVRYGELDKADLKTLSESVERLFKSGLRFTDVPTANALREMAGLPPAPADEEQAKRPPSDDPPLLSAPAQDPAPGAAPPGDAGPDAEKRVTEHLKRLAQAIRDQRHG